MYEICVCHYCHVSKKNPKRPLHPEFLRCPNFGPFFALQYMQGYPLNSRFQTQPGRFHQVWKCRSAIPKLELNSLIWGFCHQNPPPCRLSVGLFSHQSHMKKSPAFPNPIGHLNKHWTNHPERTGNWSYVSIIQHHRTTHPLGKASVHPLVNHHV